MRPTSTHSASTVVALWVGLLCLAGLTLAAPTAPVVKALTWRQTARQYLGLLAKPRVIRVDYEMYDDLSPNKPITKVSHYTFDPLGALEEYDESQKTPTFVLDDNGDVMVDTEGELYTLTLKENFTPIWSRARHGAGRICGRGQWIRPASFIVGISLLVALVCSAWRSLTTARDLDTAAEQDSSLLEKALLQQRIDVEDDAAKLRSP